LPTLFSLTNPFMEPRAVGLADGLCGNTLYPFQLKDQAQEKPLRCIPSDEHLLKVSRTRMAVSVNLERTRLTIWRYGYIRPKDGLNPSKLNGESKRPAMAAMKDTLGVRGVDRIRSPSPDAFEQTQPADLAEMQALPGMGPLGSVGSLNHNPQRNASKGRRSSLTRNDLTSTMDRMVLSRRYESGYLPPPLSQEIIQPEFWMESLCTFPLPIEECVRFLTTYALSTELCK
jgi:anaphase-promoting complex subunit 1